MKKKLISMIAIICMLIPCLFSLASCSLFDEDVTGTYSIAQITISSGETSLTYTKADYEAMDPKNLETEEQAIYTILSGFFQANMSFEIKGDNTFVSTNKGGSLTGTWSLDGNTLTLTYAEGSEMESNTLTYSDGNLILIDTNGESTFTITFSKN